MFPVGTGCTLNPPGAWSAHPSRNRGRWLFRRGASARSRAGSPCSTTAHPHCTWPRSSSTRWSTRCRGCTCYQGIPHRRRPAMVGTHQRGMGSSRPLHGTPHSWRTRPHRARTWHFAHPPPPPHQRCRCPRDRGCSRLPAAGGCSLDCRCTGIPGRVLPEAWSSQGTMRGSTCTLSSPLWFDIPCGERTQPAVRTRSRRCMC